MTCKHHRSHDATGTIIIFSILMLITVHPHHCPCWKDSGRQLKSIATAFGKGCKHGMISIMLGGCNIRKIYSECCSGPLPSSFRPFEDQQPRTAFRFLRDMIFQAPISVFHYVCPHNNSGLRLWFETPEKPLRHVTSTLSFSFVCNFMGVCCDLHPFMLTTICTIWRWPTTMWKSTRRLDEVATTWLLMYDFWGCGAFSSLNFSSLWLVSLEIKLFCLVWVSVVWKNIMFTLCLSLWESNEPGIMCSANLSGRFFRRSWRISPRVYRWKAQPKISHGEISREIRFQCNWHRLQWL